VSYGWQAPSSCHPREQIIRRSMVSSVARSPSERRRIAPGDHCCQQRIRSEPGSTPRTQPWLTLSAKRTPMYRDTPENLTGTYVALCASWTLPSASSMCCEAL
jgi:hypothetical protein